jgi:hypothetical protein
MSASRGVQMARGGANGNSRLVFTAYVSTPLDCVQYEYVYGTVHVLYL